MGNVSQAITLPIDPHIRSGEKAHGSSSTRNGENWQAHKCQRPSRALGVIPLGHVEPDHKWRQFYNTKELGCRYDERRATVHYRTLASVFPDPALNGSGNQIDSLHTIKSLTGLTLLGLVSHSNQQHASPNGWWGWQVPAIVPAALPFARHHFLRPDHL